MKKLAFIINSNKIHSYTHTCIEYLSKEIANISIEIFIDKNAKVNTFTFSSFTKLIDSKFNNLTKNPLDFKDVIDLEKQTNVTIINDYSNLSICDYLIFETKQSIDSKYNQLSKKGFLALDITYESIINSTLYKKDTPLSILHNSANTSDWNTIFHVELKKEKGIVNNVFKVLFNYSVFLAKLVNNENFINEPIKTTKNADLKLKHRIKLVNYYIKLIWIILTRKLAIKKLNWKIAIKENDKLIFIKQPEKSFWADPFIIKQDHGSVVYFEELKQNNIGRISCVKLDENHKIIENKVILDEDYHFSFPNVFFKENNYYMIPESSQNNNLQLYKCDEFPYKWHFEMNLMEGVKLLDAIWLYHDKMYWIFANKIEDFEYDNNEKLYLYYSHDLFSNNWQPHIKNPIITDSTRARNAGDFINKNNKTFRMSQKCLNGYGENLVLNEIIELSITDYKEKTVSELFPENGYVGMHTLNNSENLEVFDLLIEE